ncbi:MAG: NAD(P)-dependent oxidoreductase [Oscillospiraceae bacterium]|jgi:nucleoside-diphosphate-sugar epimerase|nr:NAD(P)-dependent oxidoreductase [Oscillospiraceae bacterium]
MTAAGSAIVTGGTGMLALALERFLAGEGAAVILVVRPGSPRLSQMDVSPGTRVVECDLGNLLSLNQERLGRCGAFYHFGWEGTFGPARDDAVLQCGNIRHTLDAAALAARLGCGVFVGAGSQAEYGRPGGVLTPSAPARPETCYGIAKLAAGALSRAACRQLGVRHVWARVLSAYGPGDNAQAMMMSCIRSLLRGERMSFTAGEQRWDYLYCGDAARAFHLMGAHGRDGAVYPLASGRPRTLGQYILAARDALDPAVEVGLGELPYPPGQVMALEADIAALTRDTGFTPAVPFEEGVRLTANWLRTKFYRSDSQ